MATACLKYGKCAPSLYNTLVNAGMDLKFIGTGDGSSYFRSRNVSRMTMFRAAKQGKPERFSMNGRANRGSNYC
jgi:hypothetical protein